MLKFLTNYGANESANELGRRKKKDKEKSTKIWYKIKRNRITTAAIRSTIIWAYFAFRYTFAFSFRLFLKSAR